MKVPFVDLSRENRVLFSDLIGAVARVLSSDRVLLGRELEAFEAELAAWFGVKYAVGVASGTDAVEIALRATANPGEPDTVGVTAFTAVPTINAIEAAGCVPLLVDPELTTRNAPASSVDIAVSLYGLPAVAEGCDVEDIAHAMGATIHGRKVGTIARCGAVSFYPTKLLGACGDGGAIITNDPEIAQKARDIRHYGGLQNGDVISRGQNSRLSEIQAAILRVKLPYVDSWVSRRREIAARYNAELAGRVTTPSEPDGTMHVHHVYVIEYDERDRLSAALKERGIGTMSHYPKAIHQYERYKCLNRHGDFPNAERLARTVLSLPCWPYLTENEQDSVIAAVKELT